MKVVSVVGARPQFVKLAPVSKALRAAKFEHKIIHTGQHYDANMSDVFFEHLGIPTADVDLGIGSGTHGAQTGAMLAALEPVLLDAQPNWVLVYGDTNSTLAAAVAAAKVHLPVAHLEAGLRSHNRLMPEELNRILTDHASDLCLAPTHLAMENLASEHLADRSVMVGDVMADVCLATRVKIESEPRELAFDDGRPFVLATMHRAENTDDPRRLTDLLAAMAGLPIRVVLTVHPRLRDRADKWEIDLNQGSLAPVDPLSYLDMVASVLRAEAVITDSGGLQKEAYLLETKCITLRTETEWPETLEGGWNVLCPTGGDLDNRLRERPGPRSNLFPYGRGAAALNVVEQLRERHGG